MDYHDLLLSQEQVEKQRALAVEQQAIKDVEIQERLLWANHPQTAKYLKQLEAIYHNNLIDVSSKSLNYEISNEEIRLKMAEIATIKKLINYLRYGQYSESVSDGNITSHISPSVSTIKS